MKINYEMCEYSDENELTDTTEMSSSTELFYRYIGITPPNEEIYPHSQEVKLSLSKEKQFTDKKKSEKYFKFAAAVLALVGTVTLVSYGASNAKNYLNEHAYTYSTDYSETQNISDK